MFLLGFGISIIGDAIMQRTLHAEFSVWFFEGLLGLIVFNAGVGIFGKAVILRIELNNSWTKAKYKFEVKYKLWPI